MSNNHWLRIEKRLRSMGLPDSVFDADWDEQVAAAVERFDERQRKRVAVGLPANERPANLETLVHGRTPWWTRSLGRSRIDWEVDWVAQWAREKARKGSV